MQISFERLDGYRLKVSATFTDADLVRMVRPHLRNHRLYASEHRRLWENTAANHGVMGFFPWLVSLFCLEIRAGDLMTRTFTLSFKGPAERAYGEKQILKAVEDFVDTYLQDRVWVSKDGKYVSQPAPRTTPILAPPPPPPPPVHEHTEWVRDCPMCELEQAGRFYNPVKALQDEFNKDREKLLQTISRDIARKFPDHIESRIEQTANAILASEFLIRDLPPLSEMAKFGNFILLLEAKKRFFDTLNTALPRMQEGIEHMLSDFMEVPPFGPSSPFQITLADTLFAPHLTASGIWSYLSADAGYPNQAFRTLYHHVSENVSKRFGRLPGETDKPPVPVLNDGTPMHEAYLAHTPLLPLFTEKTSLHVPQERWMNHTWIMGGSGSGKTSLIEHIFLHHLKSGAGMVIIDPHHDLVDRIVKADLGITDRLILLDPRDIEYPIALNPFALNRERLSSYTPADKEQVITGALQTFLYLFGGLSDLTLTGKQEALFRYCMRLMIALPDTMGRNATILDLIRLMERPEEYAKAIASLTPQQQEFFAKDFVGKTFSDTKEQIRYRLQAILSEPTLSRLLTAPETKVDLFGELNRGSIILVDTAKDFLKDGSALFGRLVISLAYQAIMERAAIPEGKRRPAFLIIDEAASYFDKSAEELLTDARKFKVGCLFAHHFAEQATHELRQSFEHNTAIQLTAIKVQPLTWELSVDRVTRWKLPVKVKPGALASLPKLPPERYHAFIEGNRRRVSLGPTDQPPPPDSPVSGGIEYS